MNSFLHLISTLDEDSHTRGIQFEKLCKWLLENHPLYKSKLKQVWLWDDWPERWGKDCGIDLVAEDVDGKTWAIQAKCYDPQYNVTKKDVDSFLSESTNTKIHHRLLIATTDGLAPNAKAVIERQREIIPISQLMLSSLLEAPIEWPKSLNDLLKASVKKSFDPRPYQQTAINKVVGNLGSRGQLIMACGTGKTLTGLWIAEQLNSQTTLILLPSLLLLSKTLEEWLIHSKGPIQYLPVCSDDKIDEFEDEISLSTSDLSFPVTTKASEIAKFLNRTGRKVIFSTYHSSGKIADALKEYELGIFDLIIADEAHRCTGQTDSDYTIVLSNDRIPASQRLFMTATPKIYTSQQKKRALDTGNELSSMDDRDQFGPVLHKLSFAEAICPPDGSEPLLTDYQVVIVGIDNSSYSEMISQRTFVKTDTDIVSDAQSFASHIGLAKAVKNYDLRRVISFHSGVPAARDFASKFPEVIGWMPEQQRPTGELFANYVSGYMPTRERTKNLRGLRDITDGQRYNLSNAKCLSEGVDVPALDGVAFIDPKNSEIDIVQAVGRAIRLSPGKNFGYIVIPVFIEDHEDPDEVLNSSPFKNVWSVINALRSHDEGLVVQLDQLRQQLGKKGTVGRPSKITIDLPTTITHKFEEALNTKLVESTTALWFERLGEYEQLQIQQKTVLPNLEQNLALGRWARSNRPHSYEGRTRDKPLEEWKTRELARIKFVDDPENYRWQMLLEMIRQFRLFYGHGNVPHHYKSPSGYDLGAACSKLRMSGNLLTDDQKQELDDLGFISDIDEYNDSQYLISLQKFKATFGHIFVPNSKSFAIYNGRRLYYWLLKGKKGELKDKMTFELDALGALEYRNDWDWRQSFEAFKKGKDLKLDINKETLHLEEVKFEESTWLYNQLKKYKKGKLSNSRFKKLYRIRKFVNYEKNSNAGTLYSPKDIVCHGIHYKSAAALARAYNVGKGIVSKNLKSGMSPENAIKKKDNRKKIICLGKEYESLAALSAATGINATTISARVKNGESYDSAVSPVNSEENKKRRKHKFKANPPSP